MNITLFAPKTVLMKTGLFVLYALFCFLSSFKAFAAQGDAEIAKKIAAIEKKSNAIIGISAIHIENNKVISHNSTQRFFMASTIKLPIAMAFLHRVDQKKDSLNRIIKLGLSNAVPGSGSLHHACERKKISMSMQQILKYMLTDSDNSASDTILHTVNGPEYVTKWMYELGFKNILINRSILEMFMDTNHVDHALMNTPRSVYSWKKIFNSIPLKNKMLAWQRFEKDKRDTTTPDEMAKLLVKLYKKEALSASSSKILINIMEQCRTGRSRIKGLLPSHVKVAHKTGTWAIDEQDYLNYPGSKKLFRFASDVGIITLPENKGHIAIAVYVKSQAASDYSRSRAIALASRAIYDHFMTAAHR
ncbi:class A beta-lactamase [Legionella worsleiensis]|uniref:Beta-lactamase n=1 Tax=Legionella worsleiensis TaxID=45076 RepID=A0A0W1AJI0_9GAMM|nr:class A beta-lactamase [Legionella worsleiensis]KTD81499.1 beta-lactamase [Legionella worsleiensis]STY32058.1 beta-lactamase [Legionella worsleiensis]